MTFAQACKAYFGLRPGKPLAEFVTEVKTLTPQDRKELAPELSKALGAEVTEE